MAVGLSAAGPLSIRRSPRPQKLRVNACRWKFGWLASHIESSTKFGLGLGTMESNKKTK